MLGFRPSLYWRLCWKVISPVFILVKRISTGVIVRRNSMMPVLITVTNRDTESDEPFIKIFHFAQNFTTATE